MKISATKFKDQARHLNHMLLIRQYGPLALIALLVLLFLYMVLRRIF